MRLAARSVENMIEVSIQDHGIGLPPEALPQLFAKFYRVDNTDRRDIKGTGLGLAICRQIIEAHGGHIWAESEGLGEGARFAFTLPTIDMRAATGDVLLVEDDAGFAQLLEAELAARGVSAMHSPSAEAALEQLAAVRPGAIVLDLILPGVQGEAFLAKLYELSSGGSGFERTPVVVVTVKDLNSSERASLEQLGAVAVLRKGSDAATNAADTVARLLAESRAGPVPTVKPGELTG